MNQSFDELKSSNAFALHFALAFLSVIIIIGRVGMYLYLRPVHSSLVIRLFTSFHSKVFDCYNCISESLARQFREFPCTRFYLMPAYLIVSAEMWKLCNLPIVRLGNSGSPICNRFDVSSSAVCYFLQLVSRTAMQPLDIFRTYFKSDQFSLEIFCTCGLCHFQNLDRSWGNQKYVLVVYLSGIGAASSC